MNCFLLAGRYTLLDQSALVELLPLCQAKSISIIIGGVFNSGILANPREHATYNYQPADRSIVDRALRISHACLEFSVARDLRMVQSADG